MPRPLRPALAATAQVQHDVVSRHQLRRLGVTVDQEQAQIAADRWRRVPPLAVVLHNGPLTADQRRWVALVNAGPGAALAARTALAVDGLTGWEREIIEIVVPRGAGIGSTPGVRVHESRRFDPEQDVPSLRLPPRTRPSRSAVDAAAWSRDPRSAVGLLAAVVQQGLARPEQLAAELERAGRIRWYRLLARALADISGGSHALSEIDFVRLCRRFALPEPVRQAVRVERSGRKRFLDAEWVRSDGHRVVAEVDGAVHLLPRNYWDDMVRANELVLDGRIVLRFAAYAIRAEPERVATQLARALKVSPRVRPSAGRRPGWV
jgi:hypothetical protein